ncbi:MAG: HAD family phosphatase [Alphaproteobacteria bacterium]|nr:HAD family phosphatase [Alphaproteobacteria bacterium]
MTPYRMLVVDLDGTALRGPNALAPEDVEAARALKERGVHVTIATGRLYGGTRWVADALGVEGSVAVMNGSERVSLADDARTFSDVLTPMQRAVVRDVLVEHGLSPFLFRSGGIHHDHADARHAPYLGIWTPELTAHDRLVDHPVWHEAPDALAIGAAGRRAAVEAAHDALAKLSKGPLGMVQFDTYDGERFLKLRNHSTDKGTALAALAAERGLRPEEVVAVGDWWNDVPMLTVAGRSYAMADSVDEVIAAADERLDAKRGHGGAIAEIAHKAFGV